MIPRTLLAVFVGLLSGSTWITYSSARSLDLFISDLIAVSDGPREQALFCFTLAGSMLLVIAPLHHAARVALCPELCEASGSQWVNTAALVSVAAAGVLLPAIAVFRVDSHQLAHHIVSGLFIFSALCFIQCCVRMDRHLPQCFYFGVRVRQAVLGMIHLYCWVYAIGSWLDPRLKPIAAVLEALLILSMLVFWASLMGIIGYATLNVRFKIGVSRGQDNTYDT